MRRARQAVRSAGVLFALGTGFLFSLSGCALLGPAPTPVPVLEGSIPEPVVSDPVEAPPEIADPEPADTPAPLVETPAPAPTATVAILYSGSAEAEIGMAERIGDSLAGPGWTVHHFDLDRLAIATPVEAAAEQGVSILAAIGPEALAVAAERFLGADIVYCQVLDPAAADLPGTVVGVAALPPLSLQFTAWAGLDPKLEQIGLITSAGFAARLGDAAAAAAAIGARLDHRISTSDRETLYIFRRLAPEIDGLWLAPDSAVLSAAVIGDILDLAAELDISVLVFSENLLERGGLLSVGAPEEHVAALVVDAIEALRSGGSDALPREIPLGEGAVRVNASVAAALGLRALPATEWVVREQ